MDMRHIGGLLVPFVVAVLLLGSVLSGITQAAEPSKIGVAIATSGKYGSTATYQVAFFRGLFNEYGRIIGVASWH